MNMSTKKHLSNRQKKKENARVHNLSRDFMESLFPIGDCSCKDDKNLPGVLFLFLKSHETNCMNIYCSSCDKLRDFRVIDEYEDISLFYGPSKITKTLVDTYGEDVIDSAMNGKK